MAKRLVKALGIASILVYAFGNQAIAGKSANTTVINCHPSDNASLFNEATYGEWSDDLFTCSFDAPKAGTIYLSLQGHQRTDDETQGCTFSIFLDGSNFDEAPRESPSATYSSTWHPSHMAEAAAIAKGKHTLSARIRGGSNVCSIHDPDIDGIFIAN